VGDDFGWCSGQVFFSGGPELAIVDRPRLVEVARTDGVASLAGVLETVVPRAFAAAEKQQYTDGGANPRFGSLFDEPAPAELQRGDVRSVAVVSERTDLPLEGRGLTCHTCEPARDFEGAAKALRATVDAVGPIDAVVVALAKHQSSGGAPTTWQGVLADHRELREHLHADAAWSRAVADYANGAERPVRLVSLTDGTSPGGRSRAQSSAQLTRVAGAATKGRLTALAASLESTAPDAPGITAEFVGHLLAHPEGTALAGAELVVGTGWIGLRAHPRPIGTVVYGGPAIPSWIDGALREIVGAPGADVGTDAT
jgi:hypothetical protein